MFSKKFISNIHKFERKLSSPTPHLIYCNNPPNDEEFLAVRHTIGVAMARQQAQSGKFISSAKYAQSLQEYIQVHLAVLNPIRRIPPEILGEIFMNYLEESFDPFYNHPPLVLAHICHRWRQVALSTAQLWRHLPRTVFGREVEVWETKRVAYLKFLLQHSSNAPITFYFSRTVKTEAGNNILTLLLGHCERWESISLVISDDVCSLFSEVQGRLPNLIRLRLNIVQGRSPFTIFQDAPKLREISLGRKLWPGSLSLPWKQITSFHEDAPNFERLARLLAESSNLEKLDIDLVREWDITSAALPSLKLLPHLTSLALWSSSGSSFTPLLSNLFLPALTEVFCGRFSSNTHILLNNLDKMIKRSDCSLQHLVLHLNTRDNDITGILSLTPQLRILEIFGIDGRLKSALSERNRTLGWAVVPQLETLTCWIHSGSVNLRSLTRTRCASNIVETDRCRRLKNFFIVSHSPMYCLADLDLGLVEPRAFRVARQLEDEDIPINVRESLIVQIFSDIEISSQYDILKIYVRSSHSRQGRWLNLYSMKDLI